MTMEASGSVERIGQHPLTGMHLSRVMVGLGPTIHVLKWKSRRIAAPAFAFKSK